MRCPYFSIVTPALNCAQFLPRNLASVRNQGVPAEELEHWVIDGGSKDGTVGLLREAGVKFISERDRGFLTPSTRESGAPQVNGLSGSTQTTNLPQARSRRSSELRRSSLTCACFAAGRRCSVTTGGSKA